MRKLLAIISLIIVVFLLVFFLHPFFLTRAAEFLVVQDKLEPADVILVLGGDGNGERVAGAVKLYKQGLAPKLLMSGGPLAWRLTYAQHMKAQAQYLGVEPKAILIEGQSRSTYENALLSLSLIKKYGWHKVILVTSASHSRRARWVFNRIFKDQDIQIISYPVKENYFSVERWWTKHEATQRVVWEYVSIIFYLLKRY